MDAASGSSASVSFDLLIPAWNCFKRIQWFSFYNKDISVQLLQKIFGTELVHNMLKLSAFECVYFMVLIYPLANYYVINNFLKVNFLSTTTPKINKQLKLKENVSKVKLDCGVTY